MVKSFKEIYKSNVGNERFACANLLSLSMMKKNPHSGGTISCVHSGSAISCVNNISNFAKLICQFIIFLNQ